MAVDPPASDVSTTTTADNTSNLPNNAPPLALRRLRVPVQRSEVSQELASSVSEVATRARGAPSHAAPSATRGAVPSSTSTPCSSMPGTPAGASSPAVSCVSGITHFEYSCRQDGTAPHRTAPPHGSVIVHDATSMREEIAHQTVLNDISRLPWETQPLPAGGPVGPASPISLQRVVGTDGVGAKIVGELPLTERFTLQGLCVAFHTAVDQSLEATTAITGWELAGAGDDAGQVLSWLCRKTPNLTAVHVVNPARDDDGEHPMLRGTDKEDVLFPGGYDSDFWSYWQRPECNRALMSMARTSRHQLKSLDLTKCAGVTDEVMRAVAQSCPELRVLGAGHCPNVTGDGIIAVARGCKELRRLSVEGCARVSGDSIKLVALRCVLLEDLCVVGCPHVRSSAILEVTKRCRGVRRLAASNVSDNTLAAIATNCNQLECLEVQGSILDKDGARHPHARVRVYISDAGMRAVADGCNHLVSFCVRGSDRVTDEGIIALAERRPQLVCLGVPRCPRITDASISVVARHGTLRHLDVQGCQSVTDASIIDVAKNCPGLRRLNVTGCTDVTDGSILEVGQNCRNLQRLSVRNCVGVAKRSIYVVTFLCKQLQWLDIKGCHQFDTLVLLYGVWDRCPDLQYLVVNTHSEREQMETWMQDRGFICEVR
eukprot:jgi/Mesvir1/13302/Mv08592-RA.1